MILAIDPGTTHSGYVWYRTGLLQAVARHEIIPNASIPPMIRQFCVHNGEQDTEPVLHGRSTVVIEEFRSYGAAVGIECLNTVRWSGRFEESAIREGCRRVVFIPRLDVKFALCKQGRATDANVRQALIDMFGPGKTKAIGLKKTPGPLYGIKSHEWAALALAVTYSMKMQETK